MTISIVLYGRNDNYGYNLHKRAALSLNCMAEVLTDPSDEILFVDYNTPDDFPTFPEAIQDTLTKRARDILRIFRVRPRIHQRFKSKTHLVALEPVARNVAIRRSCPANRWILSTNTDMIFVPRSVNSLSKITEGLTPGFYHAPRIEIPEVLWESLDRHAPGDIIATVREWGSTLHLNEIILGAEFILYDGPGDFQLLLRDDLFDNHGFHEEMLLGWHVNSNIAKRMYLKYGMVGDLRNEVYGYHCDHTRQVTPAHSHTRLQNDWRQFGDEVDSPDIPEQANTWGCVNDTIEEVRLVAKPASIYVQALREAVGSPLTEPQVAKYTHETYNRTDYDPRHMVPFLTDMFVSMPRNSNLAWYGAGMEMLSRFATIWDRLGFTGKIVVDPELVKQNDLPEAIDPTSDQLDRADAFVFDFGGLPGLPCDLDRNKQLSGQLLRQFLGVVREERRRLSSGLSSRRVIALNAINNQFESLVGGYIAAAATPCATHMRHGFVLPAKSKDDWLALLHIGKAGVRVGDHVNSDPRRLGVIAYGSYKYLDAGCYRLSVKVELASDELDCGGSEPCIAIEVHSGAEVFSIYLLSRSALAEPDHEFLFVVPQTAADVIGGIETRIILLSRVALSIQAVTIESTQASSNQIDSSVPALALKIENWLPYLSVGPLGRADEVGVIARNGPSDFVVFGPYWPLPVGYYEAVMHLDRESVAQPLEHKVRADVMTGDQQLVAANFHFDAHCTETTIRLPFEMKENSSKRRQIETRVWSSGEVPFRIRSLSVKPLEQSGPRDLLPFLLVGEAGRRVSSGIINIEGQSGVIAFSPNIRFKPGPYRMTFAAEVRGADPTHEGSQASTIALVKCGGEILAVNEITSTANQIKKHQLLFEVPPNSAPVFGLEFIFRVVAADYVDLRTLTIEPSETTPKQTISAALSLRDWLPFLRVGKGAHGGAGGIVVSEGVEGFAVFGPYWTLPPGRYEMRASVVPNPESSDQCAVVSAQVTAEEGARLFVEGKWPLGRYKLKDPAAAVEFRLPFSLSGDLPAAARTIETRIFTAGDASFRIISLAVTATSDKPESNWFPYLIVGECGVHTGGEIKSVQDKIGYIARTPPVRVAPGHYRLRPNIGVEGGVRGEDTVAFEVWSGSDLIAIETANSQCDQPLEFDVADDLSEKDFELRIRALAPIVSSIRGLIVEKVSDAIEPAALPAVLRLKNWLPFLELGAAGLRAGQSVLARQAQNGYVVHGPNWPLAAGDYEMLFAVELDKTKTSTALRRLRPKNIIKAVLLSAKLLRDGSADITFDGRQIAVVEGFTIGSFFSRSSSLWLAFEITDDDIKNGSKVETRVWSTGRRGFRIRSLIVRRKTANDRSYKQRKQGFFGLTRAKLVDRIRVLMK